MELAYDYPLYRPPSEANSMIFQVTLGCSFNKCSFCDMYRTKEYAERQWEEVKAEIDMMSKFYPDTQRVFLADGDALNLSKDQLVQVLQYLYQKFPRLERVSCYAMPKNLLGIESGNDTVLRKVTKGATGKSIVQACSRAKKRGYVLSCMIILGLGGRKYTEEHIADTAKVLSEVAPDYVGALTLHLDPSRHDEFMTKYAEPFEFLDDMEVLDELERLIQNFDPKTPVVFRANHASNVYSVKGTLPDDRDRMLALIKDLKKHPEMLKPKFLRGF
ncbi:MAG: radical SAM protein [Nitrososphaera sp.]